eukprot:9807862-Alexandrium_andersonii.AAC.1
MVLSPPDPMSGKPAAGVGCMAIASHKLTRVKHSHDALREDQRQGRVEVCLLDTGAGFPVYLASVYGVTAGNEKVDARARTHAILNHLF